MLTLNFVIRVSVLGRSLPPIEFRRVSAFGKFSSRKLVSRGGIELVGQAIDNENLFQESIHEISTREPSICRADFFAGFSYAELCLVVH